MNLSDFTSQELEREMLLRCMDATAKAVHQVQEQLRHLHVKQAAQVRELRAVEARIQAEQAAAAAARQEAP